MRVKITSNGRTTQVRNADTGEELTGVQEVTFIHKAGSAPQVDIVLRAFVAELECVAKCAGHARELKPDTSTVCDMRGTLD